MRTRILFNKVEQKHFFPRAGIGLGRKPKERKRTSYEKIYDRHVDERLMFIKAPLCLV